MSLASLTYPFLYIKSKVSSDTSSPSLISPPLVGIHNLNFSVSNLDVSLAWYQSVMSAFHISALDQYTSSGKRYTAELNMPVLGQACLELRNISEPFQQSGLTAKPKTRPREGEARERLRSGHVGCQVEKRLRDLDRLARRQEREAQ
ncbi:hypothetical protein MMC11_005456 [Xylographa trunciseda]|nr:hypothetical protein [Xylographa trunciseda]